MRLVWVRTQGAPEGVASGLEDRRTGKLWSTHRLVWNLTSGSLRASPVGQAACVPGALGQNRTNAERARCRPGLPHTEPKDPPSQSRPCSARHRRDRLWPGFPDVEYPREPGPGLSWVRRNLPSQAAGLISTQGNGCCSSIQKVEVHSVQAASSSLVSSAGQREPAGGPGCSRPGEIRRRILPDAAGLQEGRVLVTSLPPSPQLCAAIADLGVHPRARTEALLPPTKPRAASWNPFWKPRCYREACKDGL